ncbi:hypothetical protein IAI10_21165 [Clostridium sp. 19966]|uniref:hypothetical protein n=1 Tax=Clostridium sp. 19966 TaxID=2768166 RepID=UPI0028DE3E9B|nr:hypothetical protein [Clostridium sp. 19966]MDT8719165.1 hypothetical protein [Clostridium sp. 19966]
MGKDMVFNSLSNDAAAVESVDIFYSQDEEAGFTYGEPTNGNAIASFSFATEEADTDEEEAELTLKKQPKGTSSFNTAFPNRRGITPPIDEEGFIIKRCYQFRPSAIRKLNEIKAKHQDVNVYMNTLLDEAILCYYNKLFNS